MRVPIRARTRPTARRPRDLARLLAQRGIGVVYGGAQVGLMGILADTALAAGGEVIGVMPQALIDREIGHTGLTELHVVGSMHERKAKMAELSDGFVALPGGAGTLEELIEVYTWSQLGMHDKPMGVLNVNGYYDGLAALLDHAVQEGFLRAQHRAAMHAEPTAEGCWSASRAGGPPRSASGCSLARMPQLIESPSRVEAAGTKPKLIDEYAGRVNTGSGARSAAAGRRGSSHLPSVVGRQPAKRSSSASAVGGGVHRGAVLRRAGSPPRRRGRATRRGRRSSRRR